jgi:hypothetical protein
MCHEWRGGMLRVLEFCATTRSVPPNQRPTVDPDHRQQARFHFPIGALRSRDTDGKLGYLET